MSIQADIVTALAGVASGKVYPEAAPEDATVPLVVYRRTAREPLMKMDGYAGLTKSTFVFECWAATKLDALNLGDDVIAALDASSLTTKYREQMTGEAFDPETTEMMEPIVYSFWHT